MIARATLHKAFFLLPFALMGARALQAGGIYLCGILVPLFLYGRYSKSQGSSFPWTSTGLLLMAAYLVFPLHNLILWMGQSQEFETAILKSSFSSAVLVSGIMMLLIGWLDRKPLTRSPTSIEDAGSVLQSFHQGVAYASLLLGLYLLFQYLTGFDFFPQYAFREDRRFLNGTYRVTGFTSHPVTMAGVSLCFFAYYGVLAARTRETRAWLISVGHFVFILMTGCRSPALIAVLIAMILPFCMTSGFSAKKRLAWCFSVGLVSMALGFQLGLWERFKELLIHQGTTGLMESRLVFWKVHWAMFCDSPWLGHGAYRIDEAVSLDYYTRLGFGDFPRKYNAHNLFLEILSSVGILGAAGLLLIGGLLVRSFQAYLDRNPGLDMESACLCLAFALAANLMHGLTENTYFAAPVAYVYIGFLWVIAWAGRSAGKIS